MGQLHEAITVNVGEVGLPFEEYDHEAALFAGAIGGIVVGRVGQPGKYLIQKYDINEIAWTHFHEGESMKLLVRGSYDDSVEDWVDIWQKPSGELVKAPTN
jgi:hypothetical protein